MRSTSPALRGVVGRARLHGYESVSGASHHELPVREIALPCGVLGTGGDDDDRDGDAQAHADRGERRCRPRPVTAEVAEREPRRDRQAPTGRGERSNGQRADQEHREHERDRRRRGAAAHSRGPAWCRHRSRGRRNRRRRRRRPPRPARRVDFGDRRSRRERVGDRNAGRRSGRPPSRGGRGGDCEEHARPDEPPRHVEPRRSGDRPGPRASTRNRARPRAPGPHRRRRRRTPTTAPLISITSRRCTRRRSDRGEHAELASPALRDDDEPGRRDQPDEEQRDRSTSPIPAPHRPCVRLHPGTRSDRPPMPRQTTHCRPASPRGVPAPVRASDRHGRETRGRARHQRELVVQVGRVLDDADDGSPHAAEIDGVPNTRVEQLGDAIGDRDFSGTVRIPTLA